MLFKISEWEQIWILSNLRIILAYIIAKLGKIQILKIYQVETEHTTTDPTGGDDSYAEEKYGGIF